MSAADEAALARIAELLYAHAGLRFAPPRDGSLADAVSRAMERAGLRDLGDYALRLATGGASLDELCDEATVGETYFFREPEQFEFLRRHALPELLWRRGERHAMRLWSAGCASGEEAWSLAMLLEQEGLGGRSHVLATDISRAALARALRGVYGRWSLRGEAAARARPWLRAAERERGGPTFAVDERLRRLVAFDYLNLASDAYPAIARGAFSLDVVLCRNVLIYFDRDIVARVVRRLYDSLADGGWLVLASTDPSPLPLAPFHGVMTAGGMFYRRAPGPPSIHDARKKIGR